MRKIDSSDIAILRILDGMQKTYKYVPLERVLGKLPFNKKDILRRLEFMNGLKYVSMKNFLDLQSASVTITETGLDVLSIWDFRKHDVIKKIGAEIGVGKESSLLSAQTKEGWAVIKFHKYWQSDFKGIKKSFSWVAVKIRGEELNIENYMIDIPRAKAQIEFHVLNELYGKIPVPKPLGINRHAVCMQMIENAKLLSDVSLTNPQNAHDVILEDYDTAVKAGWVHGDFSEFNIMINTSGDLFYIDWPQAVPTNYSESKILMKRDLDNINNFFKKKYGINS